MAKYGLKLDVIEKLLSKKENITSYEGKNEIDCGGATLINDSDDIRFYSVRKTDGTETLTVVFRTGVNSDYWFMWRPTKNQAIVMEKIFPDIYLSIDEKNKLTKGTI